MSWSTRFRNKNNFINYHLGETATSADTGLSDVDLDRMEHLGKNPVRGFKVFGLDMGTVCHLIIGTTNGNGDITVVEMHAIHYTDLEKELARQVSIHRPVTLVADSQPYVETIHRLQQTFHNLYGSVYITSKNLEAFRVIDKAEDKQKALLEVRQVNVNRNLALNNLMSDIRAGKIGVVPQQELPTFREHLKDMKRRPESLSGFTGEGEGSEADSFVWVKTSGNDHYHHSLLYCYVAAQMAHHLPSGGPKLPLFISSFRVK